MADLLYLPWGQRLLMACWAHFQEQDYQPPTWLCHYQAIWFHFWYVAMETFSSTFFVKTSSSLPSPEGLQEFCKESINSWHSRPCWWSVCLGSFTQTAILGLVVNVSIDHTGRGGCYPFRTSCSPHTLGERWLRGCSCWFAPERSFALSRRRILTISCLKTTGRE